MSDQRSFTYQIGSAVCYVACFALPSLLWDRPIVLTAAFLALSLAMLGRWHSTRDLLFYVVAFVLGPAGEAVAVHSGAWQYTKPAFLVPLWLPAGWGCAAVFMNNFVESLLHDHQIVRARTCGTEDSTKQVRLDSVER
jgi:hypothetical protein